MPLCKKIGILIDCGNAGIQQLHDAVDNLDYLSRAHRLRHVHRLSQVLVRNCIR